MRLSKQRQRLTRVITSSSRDTQIIDSIQTVKIDIDLFAGCPDKGPEPAVIAAAGVVPVEVSRINVAMAFVREGALGESIGVVGCDRRRSGCCKAVCHESGSERERGQDLYGHKKVARGNVTGELMNERLARYCGSILWCSNEENVYFNATIVKLFSVLIR